MCCSCTNVLGNGRGKKWPQERPMWEESRTVTVGEKAWLVCSRWCVLWIIPPVFLFNPSKNMDKSNQIDWKAVGLHLLPFFLCVCTNRKTLNNKTCHCQMSVRPKELLNSWGFLWSTTLSHSRRKKNSRFDWTTSVIYSSSSYISKSYLKCKARVFLLVLNANLNS